VKLSRRNVRAGRRGEGGRKKGGKKEGVSIHFWELGEREKSCHFSE